MVDHTGDNSQSRPEERQTMGKEEPKPIARRALGDWAPAPDRPDTIKLLLAQDAGRIQHLLPIQTYDLL